MEISRFYRIVATPLYYVIDLIINIWKNAHINVYVNATRDDYELFADYVRPIRRIES